MVSEDEVVKDAKKVAISYAFDWGKSSLPPMVLATFITALHGRPFQFLPMTFPPVLAFSAYLNLSGFVKDSAGLTAAWSGLYLLLARRRKTPGSGFSSRFGNRFGARGLTRGATMGVALANVVGGGLTYAFTKGEEDESL